MKTMLLHIICLVLIYNWLQASVCIHGDLINTGNHIRDYDQFFVYIFLGTWITILQVLRPGIIYIMTRKIMCESTVFEWWKFTLSKFVNTGRAHAMTYA